MKKILATTIALCSMACLSTQAAETYTLDPTHTYVAWQINHLGFSDQVGKWYAEGTLVLDDAKPQNSHVDATIHIAQLVTGLPDLNEHLTGANFFDAAKYPIATFKSDKVVLEGKESAKVYGVLTLHGVSKPVILNVKLNKTGLNPFTNKKTVGFGATTTIKRSDFDMNTLLPALGDEVKIMIQGEANIVDQPKNG